MSQNNHGNPLVIWPGYGVNPARNNGADLEPVPIVPLRHGNGTATQMQLGNGWENTNYGKKISYLGYLFMLYSSNSNDSKNARQILNNQHPAGSLQPSRGQIKNQISNNAPTSPHNGGTGKIAPGVVLNGGFYG